MVERRDVEGEGELMSWAKFDDQYPDHPKIVKVGPLGMALHTAATCYCARYLTDGFVPVAMIARLINLDGIFIVNNGVTNPVTHEALTKELTEAGLFNEAPGGYMVHDYLEYNPPAEQVKAERERNKARQAAWKERHGDKTGSNGVGNGVSNYVNNHAPSPSPSPYPYQKEEERKREEEEASSAAFSSSPDLTAERIYQAVSKTITFPSEKRDDCIGAIRSVMAFHGPDINSAIAYLQPFFDEWRTRGYMANNTAWLTEWAVSGEIPQRRMNGNGKHKRVLTGADGQQIEVDE